jgi:ABC-2 type transport system ATP-binding protein
MGVLLRAEGLSKRYKHRTAVKDVSIQVGQGEIVAVIGPNGAGKSTTLDMVLGLTKRDSGTVAFWREDYRGHVGVQLQSAPFFPALGALENLKLFASFYKIRLGKEEGLALLKLCGLSEAADTEASKLSGGEQKRLAIAVALVHHPKLVFLDEPSAALDPRSRREIHSLLGSLLGQGTSVVFTSHDMEEVHKLAHRVVMIHEGCVAAEGTPDRLCQDFGTESLEELYLQITEGALRRDGL